ALTNQNGWDNSTVVLHFDNLYHDTPEEHVEGQSRVQTCMKMLTDRMKIANRARAKQNLLNSRGGSDQKQNSNSNGTGSSDMDVDSLTVCLTRKLRIKNCKDIVAPPLWCLPLTHSPLYLAHQWSLAEEAEQNDLFVPLEFDTEWESDDPYT